MLLHPVSQSLYFPLVLHNSFKGGLRKKAELVIGVFPLIFWKWCSGLHVPLLYMIKTDKSFWAGCSLPSLYFPQAPLHIAHASISPGNELCSVLTMGNGLCVRRAKKKKRACRNDNSWFLEPGFRTEVCNETIKAEMLTGWKQGKERSAWRWNNFHVLGKKTTHLFHWYFYVFWCVGYNLAVLP